MFPLIEIYIHFFEGYFSSIGNPNVFGQIKDNAIQLSRKSFDLISIHEHFNRCTSLATAGILFLCPSLRVFLCILLGKSNSKCKCIETHLLQRLVALKAETKFSNFQMRHSFEKITMERILEKVLGMALSS